MYVPISIFLKLVIKIVLNLSVNSCESLCGALFFVFFLFMLCIYVLRIVSNILYLAATSRCLDCVVCKCRSDGLVLVVTFICETIYEKS